MGDGRQWFPWIALEDIVGLYAEAVHGSPDWEGPVNACAPHPVTNAEFAKALGRALHRPAVLPIPPHALKVLYGDMAQIVTGGVRMIPARATELGYRVPAPGRGRSPAVGAAAQLLLLVVVLSRPRRLKRWRQLRPRAWTGTPATRSGRSR